MFGQLADDQAEDDEDSAPDALDLLDAGEFFSKSEMSKAPSPNVEVIAVSSSDDVGDDDEEMDVDREYVQNEKKGR